MAPTKFGSSRAFAVAALIWGLGVVAIIGFPSASVRITHWANGHLMEDRLLPALASEFNAAGYRTSGGAVVHVTPSLANSGEIVGRLRTLLADDPAPALEPRPDLVTPAADHWMDHLSYVLGRQAARPDVTKPIATTYLGIVTTREMARCLGWPQRDVGFEDVIRLGVAPHGWRSYPCARPEWGDEVLLAFTYPDRSSTARSLLYTFYAIAAHKPIEDLTIDDVHSPDVSELIGSFQTRLNCYLPDTLDVNLKMLPVPTCAHFFFISEDNLVKLYQGKIAGKSLERDLVMIYPREGAVVHNHSSFVPDVDWVSATRREAAALWVDFLRGESQQRVFMQDGFRRITDGPCIDPLGSPFSPCQSTPQRLIYPDRIDPAVANEILRAWR